jgi:hypothetical protein
LLAKLARVDHGAVRGGSVMTRRGFIVACCVLLSVTSMFAQSPGAKSKADPLSGGWAGELAPPDGPSVTLELKFDGKSAVSGTITGFSNPGEVKKGTFDPKTGALKLQLGMTAGDAVLLTLDGTLDKDTVTGRASGEVVGDFKLVRKK